MVAAAMAGFEAVRNPGHTWFNRLGDVDIRGVWQTKPEASPILTTGTYGWVGVGMCVAF